MMDKKTMWTLIGTAGGIAAVATGFAVIWNSAQMRLLRRTKRAEKILNRVGCALLSITQ